MLKDNPRLKFALQGISIIYSTRQPANLRQILTRPKFADKVEGIVSKWEDKRCITCKQLIMGKTFTFKSTNQEFQIKRSMNCNTRFLLYVLTCTGCAENYIGETKLRLRERMTLHRQQIGESGYQILPVGAHIVRCPKGEEMKFTVFPFHKISADDDCDTRAKEQYYIEKFKPTLNANW